MEIASTVLGYLPADRPDAMMLRAPEGEPLRSRPPEACAEKEPLPPFSEAWKSAGANGEAADRAPQPPVPGYNELFTHLVQRLREGEPAAMEELYSLFSNGMRYYLCRQLGPDDLEDKLHDAFLVVVDSIRAGELRDPSRLMGFVRTVVKRVASATIEQQVQNRREPLDEERTAAVADSSNPEGTVFFQQQVQLIREVLAIMPVRDREILRRFYFEEQPQQEICDDLGISLSQFRLMKSRAKSRFGELGRKRLQSRGLLQLFMRISSS